MLALGIWTLFLRRFVADWWFDCDGHFLQHFSGSSSELSPWVSAQALAHEKPVSVTCIGVVRLWP